MSWLVCDCLTVHMKTSSAQKPVLFILFLAALQVITYTSQSILVTLTKTSGVYNYDPNSNVLLTEVFKLLFALVSLIRSGEVSSLLLPQGKGHKAGLAPVVVLRKSLTFAVPAVLYILHNNLIFLSLLYLSAPVYQLLNNMKILTTGVVFRFMLKRKLTVIQWIALLQLTVGMGVTSMDKATSAIEHEDEHSGLSAWMTGLLLMFILALCSAAAGCWTELIVKTSGYPLQVTNAWLYSYGILFSSAIYLWHREPGHNFFDGYTPLAFAVAATNSVLGMVISFILKHGDNIIKLFASSSAVLFTAALSWPLFDYKPGPGLWLGWILVGCSLTLYYGDKNSIFMTDVDLCRRPANPGESVEV